MAFSARRKSNRESQKGASRTITPLLARLRRRSAGLCGGWRSPRGEARSRSAATGSGFALPAFAARAFAGARSALCGRGGRRGGWRAQAAPVSEPAFALRRRPVRLGGYWRRGSASRCAYRSCCRRGTEGVRAAASSGEDGARAAVAADRPHADREKRAVAVLRPSTPATTLPLPFFLARTDVEIVPRGHGRLAAAVALAVAAPRRSRRAHARGNGLRQLALVLGRFPATTAPPARSPPPACSAGLSGCTRSRSRARSAMTLDDRRRGGIGSARSRPQAAATHRRGRGWLFDRNRQRLQHAERRPLAERLARLAQHWRHAEQRVHRDRFVASGMG